LSRKLLRALNGPSKGSFAKWLDGFEGEPRIAWYPSAGSDFRDLLYLHPGFAEIQPASKPEPPPPDIFLHTDYYPWSNSSFLDSEVVHIDDRTSILARSVEELPRCDLPLDDRIVDFPSGSEATGRVFFLELEVRSDVLGSFVRPLIYAFVENAAFCAERILPLESRISHIVHVRFGGGCGGGGKSTGIWLLNVLRKLGCELFVTDGHGCRQSGDTRIYELYPSLSGNESASRLEQIRVIASEGWSGHGDVSWNIVKEN
jgi:hypothetical protein